MKLIRKKIDAYLEAHPKLEEIITTPEKLTDASLYLAFGISLAFTLFCIISGLFGNTRWFMTLGIYNFVLAIVRLFTALEMQRLIQRPLEPHPLALREARICLASGIALLSVNLAFIGIIAETIIRNHSMHYHPFILFFLILFSLIRFIVLFIGAIRNRRDKATLNHALRVVNLTVALVSVYTTQTAVLETYLSSEITRLILNLIASSLIFYVLLRISVGLILSAHQALDDLNK